MIVRKKERAKTIIYIIVRVMVSLLLTFAVIGLIRENNDENKSRLIFVAINSFILLGISFLPSILEHAWKINIPSVMEIVFIGFCICAILLGEIGDFYIRYSWWDSILHTLSGSLIACVGFIILNYFNNSDNYLLKMNPFICSAFVLCFAVTCGVIWEIFEFLIDGLYQSNMQRYKDNISFDPFLGRSALKDTMKDLILDLLGASIVAVLGYIDLKIEKGIISKLKVERILKEESTNNNIN